MVTKDFQVTRPPGCTCVYPWQVCDACKDVPRQGGRVAGVPMSNSAFRLARTVEENLIPEQVKEFKAHLWNQWDGAQVDGQAAAAALARMAGEPDPAVADRNREGYPTRRV